METTPPSSPSYVSKLKRSFTDPRILSLLALAVLAGAAGAGIGWRIYLKPMRAIAQTRYQSHVCLMRLYDLQMAHRKAHGTFANGLDALLVDAPDGAELREKLKVSTDINTLAVVGDAKRFRLEVNVLDPTRTSVKIRGPFAEP